MTTTGGYGYSMQRSTGAGRLASRLRSTLLIVLGLIVVCGVAALLVNAPAPAALVGPNDWSAVGGVFQNARPASHEVPGDILADPRARFFRTWSPQTGATRGTILSGPFSVPEFIGVPIAGYPIEPGLAAYVECLANSKKINLVSADPHENWALAIVRIPSGWCPSQSRLVAESTSTSQYVAVGTPYALSWIWYVRYSAASMAGMHLLAFCCFIVPLLGLSSLFRAAGLARVAGMAAYSTWFTLCYGLFFLAWWDRQIAAYATVGFFSAMLVSCIAFAIRLGPRALAREWSGLGATTLYYSSLLMTAVLWLAHSNAGLWDPAYRFAPAAWSSDHAVPIMVANGLFDRTPIQQMLGGGWHVSDRPPLMSGWLFFSRVGWKIALLGHGADALLAQAQIIAEIVGQCTVVVAMYALLSRLLNPLRDRIRAAALSMAMLAALATPFLLFNLVYGWPKLLSAAMGLLAVTALVMLSDSSEGWGPWDRIVLTAAAGVFVALAMLSHAAVVFGLASLPLLLVPLMGWRKALGYGIPALLVSLVLFVPWMTWQARIDPPGNALTKFALAGTLGLDHPETSVSAVVANAYGPLSLKVWLGMKAHALAEMFGTAVPPEVAWIDGYAKTNIGRMREADFLSPFRALSFLVLPMLCVLLPRRAAEAVFMDDRTLPIARIFLLTGLAGLVLNTLVTWSMHIMHHQSYLSLLFMLISGLLALVAMKRPLAAAVVIGQLLYSLIVWITEPLVFEHHPDLLSLCVAAIALCALGIEFYHWNAGTTPSCKAYSMGAVGS